jgi:hypothetical protein
MANCPDCGEKMFSEIDQAYLLNFKTCWICDKQRWDKGELSTEEFEAKEEVVYPIDYGQKNTQEDCH